VKSLSLAEGAGEDPSYPRQSWIDRGCLCFLPRAGFPRLRTTQRSDQALWFRRATCYLFSALRLLCLYQLSKAYLYSYELQFQESELPSLPFSGQVWAASFPQQEAFYFATQSFSFTAQSSPACLWLVSSEASFDP
jgi:hypothetical protein